MLSPAACHNGDRQQVACNSKHGRAPLNAFHRAQEAECCRQLLVTNGNRQQVACNSKQGRAPLIASITRTRHSRMQLVLGRASRQDITIVYITLHCGLVPYLHFGLGVAA
jgi:hypothetical protein